MSQLPLLGTVLRSIAFAVALALSVQAQQFQVQAGAIPGTARWSEGVEAVDVDLDGDLDLCFADGEGFSTPGTKRQNVLVINKLVETGPGIFADESVARLGVHVSNAKCVTAGDVNGDGWPDLLYANAFNTDPPFLYINQGAANPGFFTLESASRGLTTAYSSSGAQFGDLDLDGDLDLIVCDSGASLLGAPGGKPHLFINDGTGHFTEDAAALGAPTKRAHMDVQLVDVDNDWDLDFLGACRSSNAGGNHYLMLNNGAATFSDASSLVPSGSSNTYEVEVGDLDGDTDLDLFFVSIAGLSEGAARNELVPGPGLAFTALPGLAGSIDDNEILLLDYDGDDDQDAFVGSLGTRENLWRNDGGFVFTNRAVDIQAVSDSTLDMTAADLDNDGDYDLVTAQGESNPGQWANKVYLNSGPADVIPPTVTAVKGPLGVFVGDPILVLARVRDQMMDDGVNHVSGFARWVVDPGHPPANVTVDGAGFTPASISVPAGTTVTWTHGGGGAQSVTSATAPWTFDSGSFTSGTFAYTFVTPGTYDVTSTPSGSMGQVVVTGSATDTAGTHAGGGMHRFALPSPSGVRLVYELWFSDWPGNQSVTESAVVALTDVFPRFCDASDGALASCPCGNAGAPDSGCDLPQATGGVSLDVLAQTTSPNGATLQGSGFSPMGSPTAIVLRSPALDAGTPVVFGDGLRCVAAAGLVRLAATTASAGTSLHAFGHGAGSGDFYYQLWLRSTPSAFCDPAAAFNLSNGRRITW